MLLVTAGCGEVASYSYGHTVMLQYNVLILCTCTPVNGLDNCNNSIISMVYNNIQQLTELCDVGRDINEEEGV